ncbi:MAG: fimbrial biogenesis chaperone [Algiphilus sp.]
MRSLVAGLLAAFALANVPDAEAGLRVHPLRLQMSDSDRIAELQVRNIRATDSVMQVRVVRWQQDMNGKMVLRPAPEMVVSPPAFLLPPDGEQLVRIGRRSVTPQQRESAYRVIVEEVADQARPGVGLQMRMRVRLPLFVTPAEALSHLHFDARPDCLWVENQGNRRARLSTLELEKRGGGWVSVAPSQLSYVLAASGYCLRWPDGAPNPRRLRFELHPGGGGTRVLQ